ncbi:MAG: hypothetical protein OK404_01740 [Thaumarchaeota archaeon]|nr:hypothetical protein [Nitrososphaerota archaeon]
MHWVAQVVKDSGLELVVFNGTAGALAVGAQILLNPGLLPAFGFAILIESVALMLVGGALDLSTATSTRATMNQLRKLLGNRIIENVELETAEQRRRVGISAATYAITGVLLFVEAGLLSLAYI